MILGEHFWLRIFYFTCKFFLKTQTILIIFYSKEKHSNLLLHTYSMYFRCTKHFLERFEVEKFVPKLDLTLIFGCGKTLKNPILKLIFPTSSPLESWVLIFLPCDNHYGLHEQIMYVLTSTFVWDNCQLNKSIFKPVSS